MILTVLTGICTPPTGADTVLTSCVPEVPATLADCAMCCAGIDVSCLKKKMLKIQAWKIFDFHNDDPKDLYL